MESTKIEALLELYFEGNSSLDQEAEIRAYFLSNKVAPHLQPYKPMFLGFEKAANEVASKEIALPSTRSRIKPWWYSVATMLVVAIGVAGFMFSQPSLTQEEKEAIAAFEQSREAMMLLSKSFNEGAEELAFIDQFSESKNKILK